MKIRERLTIGICDDDNYIRQILDSILKKYSVSRNIDIEFLGFKSGTELINNPKRVDALFLDIIMPGMDGIEAGRILRHRNVDSKIIMLTGDTDRFQEAFEIEAFRFIVKPPKVDEIFKVLDDVVINSRKDKKVPLYKNGLKYLIPQKEILYIEANGSTSIIQTANSEFRSETSLSAWLSELDKDVFFRTHKSFIVNICKITCIDGCIIRVSNGNKVLLSKRNQKSFFNFYELNNTRISHPFH